MPIVTTGIKEVQEMLGQAPKNIVLLGYGRAATAAMNVFAKELVSRTPVKTGKLAKALVIDVEVDSQARGVAGAVGFGKQGFVANLLEYGHEMIGHKPGKKKLGEVQPHPFIRASFDTAADAALDAFANSLAQTLNENY